MTSKRHLVFVYGSLKRGFHNNRMFLESDKFLGVRTTESLFTMYSGLSFPYLLKEGANRIIGELWEVCDQTLARLDYLEGVEEDHYQRINTRIISPGSESNVDAQIYVASEKTASWVRNTYVPVIPTERGNLIVQNWGKAL